MSSIDERFPQPLLLGGGAQPNGLASLSTGHSESLVDTFFASHPLLVSNFYQWRRSFFGVAAFLGQRDCVVGSKQTRRSHVDYNIVPQLAPVEPCSMFYLGGKARRPSQPAKSPPRIPSARQ